MNKIMQVSRSLFHKCIRKIHSFQSSIKKQNHFTSIISYCVSGLILSTFFIIVFVAGACQTTEKVDDLIVPTDSVIAGPNPNDYDFYIGMSYSGPQPSNNNLKSYYIIITSEGVEQSIESVDIEIQETKVGLEYANYDGKVFYIAYFNLEYADTYNFSITINGEETVTDIEMIKELYINLPSAIEANKNIPLSWTTERPPMNTYIEGFQRWANGDLIIQSVKNFSSDIDEFIMPANWLWSDENTKKRAIQIGIMNFKIENRVCFAVSDDEYKSY